jgi:N-methylhydantoinase A
VALRAVVQGRGIRVKRPAIARDSRDPKAAAVGRQPVTVDRRRMNATVYDRARLKAGNRIRGPAIVMEMDSTTVVLPKHTGLVDRLGNILIYPDGHKGLR